MKRRVVVTGLGAVTPIGNTVDVFGMRLKRNCRDRTDHSI